MPHHVASSSSPAGQLHATTLPPASLRATPSDNNYEDEAGAVPSNLSPASLSRGISRHHVIEHVAAPPAQAASGVCQEPTTNWMSRMTMTRIRKKCRCHPLLPSPFSIRTISSAPVYGLVLNVLVISCLGMYHSKVLDLPVGDPTDVKGVRARRATQRAICSACLSLVALAACGRSTLACVHVWLRAMQDS
ncbi:hypothetical protein BGY98DRAFT_270589 [Russula aff. rugulosa BPL654]|nr:hypothetical protein BGY98DRAFT_270589 [Russula aff. rugulosa BPL654]